ncbi:MULTISPECIES: S1C family serine protease [Staphylococcus]|uniref:Serine protease HtrA-like n=1 Tax=Staphylococcus agnetis TaxID=985762 RepID=A0A2T4MKW7_9STAP|nr:MULTISPECIES: S1C family serine protease [Staphylococcus]NHM91970.1 PDZ domain-containing protein [Staphylococcus sp. 10602379]NJI02943.1 PDZ domain-containing protein [Staphylococcus agnetis]NJI13564.1 PDZ domain-containing protein [Staphylococcus agnetis]PTH16040.1 serine protease [Staphylococcus agnetis]PTH30303.1 serine protease [Staphylococcus agnetis]
MDQDKKHVIPRHKYKRKRREFFHNDEREARIKAEEEATRLKKEREKAQVKNNEERVKDNLRKARIEKITHEDKVNTGQLHENDTHAEQSASNQNDALQSNLYKQQAQEIKKHTPTENKKRSQTSETSSKHDNNVLRDEQDKHRYSAKKDWTEKITQFITKEWAKILIVLAAILILVLLFAIFNNVNRSDDNVRTTLEHQQKEQGTHKQITKTMEHANAALNSVVAVESQSQSTPVNVQDVKNQSQQNNETGSGVVYKKVDDSLYILTNAHVIGTSKTQTLTYLTDKKVSATVVGTDKWSDIAVLKVSAHKAKQLKPIHTGNSDKLVLGEPIIVMGNPLGLDFYNSVGEGIISGLNRNVPVDIDKDNQYDMLLRAFQVDAPINPGDSGGAIIDQNGDVVGIASLKITMPNVEGMAFGIPINDALKVAKQLEKDGKITYPNTWLGMQNITELTENERQTLKLPQDVNQGVIVKQIENKSPAKDSGLQKDDIIVKLDGQPIKDTLSYKQQLFRHTDTSKPLKLKVMRQGHTMNIAFKLK